MRHEEEFWNYNEEYFIQSATRFSKDTLLHLYIVTRALNHYSKLFRKFSNAEDENTIEKWYDLFRAYSIRFRKWKFEEEEGLDAWFEKNYNSFVRLFDEMAKEVFYLLFSNRKFLLSFNVLTSKTIKETRFPSEYLTGKGTIKRISIPQWVKKAVFLRDKGRCVFCNTDLTGLINNLVSSNYDHMQPLDLHGVNDPCNIQLACEKCNKTKTNKDGSTSSKYAPWWEE